MKPRSHFWTLLKNELALGLAGPAAFIIMAGMALFWWSLIGFLPMVPFYSKGTADGNFLIYFEAGLFQLLGFQLLFVMNVWITLSTVPALRQILSPGGATPAELPRDGGYEFIFTRAVNRKTLLRAKTAFWIIGLGPLYLNLLVSPLAPEVHIPSSANQSAAEVRSQAALHVMLEPRLESYRKVFPASAAGAIPHGAVALCAWWAWAATLAGLLLQGYSLLIAPLVKPNNAWTALYAVAPSLLLSIALLGGIASSDTAYSSRCEKSFLFFAGHPVSMILGLFALALLLQLWCESRFSQLELL